MATANQAGLYFVDAAGKVVDEGDPTAVQQFVEEDLRSRHLGPYASKSEEAVRVLYAERRAKADLAAAERRKAEQQATAEAAVAPQVRELQERIDALEVQLSQKAKTPGANKAVAGPPEDK